MTRDIFGRKIKKRLTSFEQVHLEKFYIHNNKIFQIVRIKEHFTIKGEMVDISFIKIKSRKIKTITMSRSIFENRKNFHTYKKAITFLNKKDNNTFKIEDNQLYLSFSCPNCSNIHYRQMDESQRMIDRINNDFNFQDSCNQDQENYFDINYNIMGAKEFSLVDLTEKDFI